MYGIYVYKKLASFFHIGKMEHSERRRRGGVEGEEQQSQCVSLRRIKAAASEMHSNNGHIRVSERERDGDRESTLL